LEKKKQGRPPGSSYDLGPDGKQIRIAVILDKKDSFMLDAISMFNMWNKHDVIEDAVRAYIESYKKFRPEDMKKINTMCRNKLKQ